MHAPARQRRPAQMGPAIAAMTALPTIKGPRAQAAVALAQALRDRGHAALESAGTDGAARVLVVSRPTIRLTEDAHVGPHDGEPWFWWSGKPLCPADDIDTAADAIDRLLTAEDVPGAARAGRLGVA